MPVKLCIFDYDDTLVKTKECKFKAIKELGLRYYSKEISSTEINSHWGIPYKELFHNLFQDVDANIERVITRYEDLNTEYPVIPFEDCFSTLQELHKYVKLGIVSSCRKKVLEEQLESMHFPLKIFSFIYGEENCFYHKPDPRVFEPAKEFLNENSIHGKDIIYCGDSTKDMIAAQKAGFCFVGVNRHVEETNLMRKSGAKVVENLGVLIDLLKK